MAKQKPYLERRMDEFREEIADHVPPSSADFVRHACEELADDLKGRVFDQVEDFFETWIGRCYEARVDCAQGLRHAA